MAVRLLYLDALFLLSFSLIAALLDSFAAPEFTVAIYGIMIGLGVGALWTWRALSLLSRGVEYVQDFSLVAADLLVIGAGFVSTFLFAAAAFPDAIVFILTSLGTFIGTRIIITVSWERNHRRKLVIAGKFQLMLRSSS